MKFQDGFKKKLVQTDFHLNFDNALMTLRKKGGVTVSLWDRVWRSFCRFCAAAVSSPAACRPRLRLSSRTPASCAKLVDMRAEELIS